MFEALTLIQTGKISHFPVVLFGVDYWKGLVDWLCARVAPEGKISKADLDLIVLTDDPGEAARTVIAAQAAQMDSTIKRLANREVHDLPGR